MPLWKLLKYSISFFGRITAQIWVCIWLFCSKDDHQSPNRFSNWATVSGIPCTLRRKKIQWNWMPEKWQQIAKYHRLIRRSWKHCMHKCPHDTFLRRHFAYAKSKMGTSGLFFFEADSLSQQNRITVTFLPIHVAHIEHAQNRVYYLLMFNWSKEQDWPQKISNISTEPSSNWNMRYFIAQLKLGLNIARFNSYELHH